MSGSAGRPERMPLGSLTRLASTTWAPWPVPAVVDTTPSTMAEVETLAAAGAPEGTAVVAEEQTAGRGRRGRSWESASRAGLWWSLLLRPSQPAGRLGWLPLVVGVGVAQGIRAATGLQVRLKWPNDVLAGSHKVAGVLAERLGDASVVVGVGINIDHADSELPEGGASLRSLGLVVDRTDVLICVLAAVAEAYREWESGADIGPAYIALSATLGSEVRADLGDRIVTGRASRLGPSGELVVLDDLGTDHVLSAGDVTVVRAAHGG
jgi:BirA family biotin operon repressor/biotin-[acetyl-CoA-carboxylase] ligase